MCVLLLMDAAACCVCMYVRAWLWFKQRHGQATVAATVCIEAEPKRAHVKCTQNDLFKKPAIYTKTKYSQQVVCVCRE